MFDKETEKYIEHEVFLRVHDKRFQSIEQAIQSIDNKFNWIVGIFVTSLIIPIVLHLLHLI